MAAQNSRKPQQVLRYVYVKEFLKDEQGAVFGIKGITWPDRLQVSVVLDNECEKAKNSKRPTFAKIAKGYSVGGKKFIVKPGSMLRLRTLPSDEPIDENILPLKTDWINVVTYDQEDTKKHMKFGLVHGKTRTSSEVREKRKEIMNSSNFRSWVAEQIKKTGHELSKKDYNMEIERRLTEALPGNSRFYGSYFVYQVNSSFSSGNPQTLHEELVKYFSDPAFLPQESDMGTKYRPVRPHLIIRGMNDCNEYTGRRTEFMPQDAEIVPRDENNQPVHKNRRFRTPEECAQMVIASLPKGCASWNILPAKVYTQSLVQMTMDMDGKNNYAINKISELNFDCHKKLEDGSVNAMAFPMALRLTANEEKPCVVELIRDYRLEAVDPVLVDRIERASAPGEFDRIIMLKTAPVQAQKLEYQEDEGSFGPTP